MDREALAALPNVYRGLPPEDRALFDAELRQAYQRVVEDPLRWGPPPHVGQELIHCSTHNHILLVAANRWGKSTFGMRESLWRATGTHPYKRLRPHNTIWIGYPDHKFYRRVTKKHFDAWAPKKYLIKFYESDRVAVFQREDGGRCEVFFLSYLQDRDSWQGGAVDFLWMDEEPPEDISNEAMARLIDTRGSALRTLTPLSGMGWLYDELYLPAKEGRRKIEVHEAALAEYREDLPHAHNVGRPLVPHLDREQILRFAEEIPDPDEKAIRIFGMFRSRTGLVFKKLDEVIHLVDSFDIPPAWDLWAGMDPGFHGFAVNVFTQEPGERVFQVASLFSQGETAEDRLEDLYQRVLKVRKRAELRKNPLVIFVDTEDPQVVLELNTLTDRRGIPLVFVSLDQGLKARKAGIMRLQQLLQPRSGRVPPRQLERPTGVEGEPMCYFFRDAVDEWRIGDKKHTGNRLWWELNRYQWKRRKEKEEDDPDEASAHGAHAIASYRYAMMARMGAPEEPKPDRRVSDTTGEELSDEAQWVQDYIDELEDQLLRGEET